MIDEGALADPSRCPACGWPLDGRPTCPRCGLPLAGEDAQELWLLSQQAAAVLARRQDLIARLRASTEPIASGGPGAAPWPGPRLPPVPPPGWTPPPARPKPEWTKHRVQNLLLVLGVLLLGVAAIIFVAVSWGRLGVGARTALLAAVTAVAAAATFATARRGLTASTEALAVLTTGLCVLDAYGLRRAGVAGLDVPPGAVYWAAALAVLAALAALAVGSIWTISLQLVAVGAGSLPALLLGGHAADASSGSRSHAAAWFAAGALVDTVGLVAALHVLPRPGARVTRGAVLLVLTLVWGVGLAAAAGDGFVDGHSPLPGALLLAGFAAVALAAGLLVAPGEVSEPVWMVAATVATTSAVLLAVWTAPASWWRDQPALPTALAVAALALLAALVAAVQIVRLDRRPGRVAAVVLGVAAVAPVLAVVEPVGVAATSGAERLDVAWSEPATVAVRRLLTQPWDAGRSVPLLLVAAAVAVAIAGYLLDQRRAARAGALVLLGVAVLTTGPALDLTLAAAVVIELVAALTFAVASLWLVRRGDAVEAGASLVTGMGLAVLGVSWAFGSAGLTVLVLTLVTVAAAVLAAAPRVLPTSARAVATQVGASVIVLAVVALAAGLGSVATLTRWSGGGWPAVWSLTAGAALVAAVAAFARLPAPTRPVLLGACVALAGVEAASSAWWAGADQAWRGFVATAVAAGLAVVIGYVLPLDRDPVRIAGLVSAAAVASAGTLATIDDTDVLWLALLVAGVAASALALRPRLHEVRWLALALLTASSWVRLAMADVDAPEAYTAPPAVVLLALAWWQRRGEVAYSSWPAYGPGLALGLLPSLARAVTDAGSTRPLLLGLAALAVLLVGVARRMQAPLLLGGGVLAVDALVQLAPYLAQAYDAVPRWVSIGTVGVLLLVMGATFERRVNDVRQVRDRLAGMS